ncbi:unnamed protein product [Discosporangium mesarthrocarpum]
MGRCFDLTHGAVPSCPQPRSELRTLRYIFHLMSNPSTPHRFSYKLLRDTNLLTFSMFALSHADRPWTRNFSLATSNKISMERRQTKRIANAPISVWTRGRAKTSRTRCGITSLVDWVSEPRLTVTTVGYGDLSNHGEGIKLFACAYILCGVAMIGSLLSSLVEMVVDRQEDILVKMLAAGEVQTKAEEVGRETVQSTSEASTFMPRMKAKMTYHQVRVFNSAVIFVALVALGVVVFGTNGQLDVVDAFYLTIVSASTVGYGDYYPKTAASKTFAIFFLPLATLMLAKIITDYTEMRVEEKTVSRQHAILMASIGSKEFLAMDTNRDGKLSRLEFLERMLVAQEKCGAADIQAIHARFDQIDVDGSGFIEEREAVMTFD